LTRILDGFDELEADRHEIDPTQPLDVVELAAARQPDVGGDVA
jgi:hypothetical protein